MDNNASDRNRKAKSKRKKSTYRNKKEKKIKTGMSGTCLVVAFHVEFSLPI
jgi:hypothetical protein